MKLNDYIYGLLYGDGVIQTKHNKEYLFFSTTHKELADMLSNEFSKVGIKYSRYTRSYDTPEKENYEILEIIESNDITLLKYLNENNYRSANITERLIISPDFIRGYLETKGSLFKYFSRRSEAWRISLSGQKEELRYIESHLSKLLDIKFSKLTQRKEREDIGIISGSYRISIQNRNGIAKFIYWIDNGEQVSKYLKQKIDEFKSFHETTPFNVKRKIFKHYKNAVKFMARTMELEIKGVRGGGGSIGYKPIYLWEANNKTMEFQGWEGAYNWICKEFKNKTGFEPPKVE